MNRLAKLVARYLGGHRGFSIGIDDVTPEVDLLELKAGLLSDANVKTDAEITAYEAGRNRIRPGCNALESLEAEITDVLSAVRQAVGEAAMRKLRFGNSPRIMADAGSKGSIINISQMIACLGQQAVDGKRIQDGSCGARCRRRAAARPERAVAPFSTTASRRPSSSSRWAARGLVDRPSRPRRRATWRGGS